MNKHLYRIVFNKARGALMAVAEIASSQGKKAGTTGMPGACASELSIRLLCFSVMLAIGSVSMVANAQIVADPGAPRGQQPTVLNAGNGVPLVNIQTPSAAGVSRNTYGQFDVGQPGAILNNSRTNTQSQLGGFVQGNPWLANGTARVILNEVNASNPSQLRGYVEVAGDRAQVVIANPAGISCGGCGFINANRVTLTTGTPILNGGSLDGYRVQGGSVNIIDGGLDASRVDYTDIIARSVSVNAGIWANALKVTAGANEVTADHSQSSPVSGTGAAPQYGIDVAALGGMYAGKITLVGTDAGVGVRNAGQIGATAGDVIVTADGRLENRGRLTASAGVRADSNGGIANSGTVYAQGDTQLNSRGDIDNTGTIVSGGNTQIAAAGPAGKVNSHAGSVMGAGVQADGTLGGNASLQVRSDNQLAAQGQNLASGDVVLEGADLELAGSQTSAGNLALTARTGGIDASGASLFARQSLIASAARTLSTDGASASAQQLQLAAWDLSNVGGEILQTGAGDLSVRLPGTLDNTRGRIASNSAALSLGAQALVNVQGRIEHAGAGDLTVDANTVDGAQGTIVTNGGLALRTQTATLDGANTVANRVQIDAANLSHRGATLVQTGTTAGAVKASNRLDNSGGTIASNGDIAVAAGDLKNQGGTIQTSGGSLDLQASGTVDNGAQGRISAAGNATVNAGSLLNTGGTLTAGESLQVQASGLLNNERGVIAANGLADISGASVKNAGGRLGSTQSGLRVTATNGAIDNTSGRLEAAQNVDINASGLMNGQGTVAGKDVTVDTRGQTLDNTGGVLLARGTLDVQSGKLVNNAGALQAAGGLSVDTNGQALVNTNSGTAGGILGQSSVALRTGELDNQEGFIGAKGALTVEATQIANTQGGQISGERTVQLAATGLDNQGGSVQAMGATTIDVGSGTVDNQGGLLRSGDVMDIQAGRLDNAGSSGANQGVGARHVAVTADQVNNRSGNILADETLSITGSGSVNNAQGTISSGQELRIQDRNTAAKTQTVVNTGGTLIAGKSLAVDSAGLSGDGRVLSQGDLSLGLTSDFTNTGEVQANGNASVQTSGRVTNQAVMRAGKTLTVSAADIDNQVGGDISAATTSLRAQNAVTNRGLIDGGQTHIDAGTINNLGTGRIYGDHVAIQAGTLNNDVEAGKAAVIAARERLDIGAQTINNREHALVFSGGDMVIGGTLDADRLATGSAGTVNNNSASIEALGDLVLAAGRVNNTDEHFATAVEQGPTERVIEYQGSGSPNRYKPGDPDVYVYNDESDHLHTPEGNFESWTKYEYDRSTSKTVITHADPGKITSGGAMRIDADTVFNDKGHIIAGGAFSGRIGSLTNAMVDGESTVTDRGTATSFWRDHEKGRDRTGSSRTAYAPPSAIEPIKLMPTVYKEFTAPSASGTQISGLTVGNVSQAAQGSAPAAVAIGNGRTVAPITEVAAVNGISGGQAAVVRTGGASTVLPDNALFRLNPSPTGGYLVETDPRFADYRTWLSSDYMLSQLRLEPDALQKRLGDGFYEQKLIREQVAQLTGRRLLDGYASDEAQYRALLDGGVTYAKEWGLRPGVALTPAQMAQLTSDIVWLVEKEVKLPDGATTRALVPQVYVRVKPGDIDGSGALMAGQTVNLNVSGDLINRGSIAGRDVVAITAENIKNLGGRITGGDVALQAQTDLSNLGGIIDGNQSLAVRAGRDLNVETTTRSNSNAQGSITNVGRMAGLYVTAPSAGVLVASAGRDVNLLAAQIGNASNGGQTVVAAGNDLNLKTVEISNSQSLQWDGKNWRKDSTQQEVGASIQTNGDLRLSAGNDLTARGAQVTSDNGALVATAGNNVQLLAAQTAREVDEAHQHKSRSGFLSKKTITTRDTLSETTAQGSTLSGNITYVQAGNDIDVVGSNVVSTAGTTLIAKNDVRIEAARETADERHLRDVKKSGIFSSGGIGFTIGKQQQSQDNRDVSGTAAASTVGSTDGSVAIGAGKAYQQVGSNVLAPKGDIAIQGETVDIVEAQESIRNTQESKFKQSGLTVAVTAPVISAIQTAQQMSRAAGETKDARMQALAGATTALAGKNAVDAVTADPQAAGGIGISITVGSSKSGSKSTQDVTQAAGSQVAAGGDVSIRAAGAGQNSDITVQGSDIKGGGDVALKADGDIELLAARNASEMQRSSSSQSAGVGVAITVGSGGAAFGITANASGSRGKGEGTDVNWTNTHVTAGNRLTLESGGDTTLRGAVASGKQVVADVGGNLNLESLQDTSTYHSKDQSLGGSVTFGAGFSGSVNYSQQKIDSDFASVTEQSGIRAGDGGFQVNVGGNTDLKGAVIASTDKAVQDGANSLVTATLTQSDIQNRADYKGSSLGIGGGYSVGNGGMMPIGGSGAASSGGVGTNQQGQATTGGDKVPGSNLPTSGNWSVAPPVVMGAEGSASTVTGSGISGGAIRITDESRQQALTGKDGEQTVASINRNVSTERDNSNALKPIFNEQEIQAGFEITGAFLREGNVFLGNRTKEAQEKERLATDPNARNPDGSLITPEQRAQYARQAREINDNWGPGGTYRQIATALMAGAGGNVTGGVGNFVQNSAVAYLQTLAANQVKQIADALDSDTARAALHAVVGCAGAAASSQSCAVGALGAAGGSIINNLLDQIDRDSVTPADKEVRSNLVSSLVAGITAAAGGNAATAANAARIETENNRLATSAEVKRIRQLSKGDPKTEARLTAAMCALIHCEREYPEGSQAYEFYKSLSDLGASESFKDERALLASQKDLQLRAGIFRGVNVQPLFTYDWKDSVGDATARVDNEYQLSTRAFGGLQAVGGGASALAGGSIAAGGAAACAPTAGASCLAAAGGVALTFWGLDQYKAGVTTMISGQPQATVGGIVLQQVFGISPAAAELLYGVAGGVGGIAGDLALLNRAGQGVKTAGSALGNAERGVLTDANFAQNRIRSDRAFSPDGQKVYSGLAGRPITTVDDLAEALRSGVIKPSQLPVDYVEMNGTRLILNTRTSTALEQAGIPRNQWFGRNQTGVEAYPGKTFNDLAADQLKNNNLPPTGAEQLKSVRR